VTLLFVFLLVFGASPFAGLTATPHRKPTVESRAMELLQANCFSCHSDEKRKGGLSLTSRGSLEQGGENGPVLTPGQPSKSRLLSVLAPTADPHMPPKKQLPPDDIKALERWIKNGARWDAPALLAAEERVQPVRLRPLPPTYRPVLTIAISPDDHWLACGHGPHITIFDLTATNLPIRRRLTAHPEGVQSLAWSPDSRSLASAGFRRLTLWDRETGERHFDLTNGLVGRITALAFLKTNHSLIAADSLIAQRGFLRLIDAAKGAVKASWPAHTDSIYGLDVSADGHRVISAGADKLIKVWDTATREERARLEGHGAAVTAVAFNSNATQVVSASVDRELKVWDIETREKILSLGRPTSPLTAVRWLTNDHAILAANEDGTLLRYTNLKAHSGEQSSSGGNEKKLADSAELLLSLAATQDGRLIAAGGQEGTLLLWNRDGKVRRQLNADALATNAIVTTISAADGATTAAAATAAPGSPTPAAASTPANPSPRESRHLKQPAAGSSGPLANSTKRSSKQAPLSFVRDVLPVLSKAGCNGGACHAKPEGQNGFKLSVFSFDPKSDYAEIVKETRGRRIFPAAPEESLLLKKPTLAVPHEGGERFKAGSDTYELLARWIREGMLYQSPDEPALVQIDSHPSERVYRKGARQRLRVTAQYTDGSSRDVTDLASFDSNDKELATVDEHGRVRVGRLTGQGVIVARFMGFVADSKVTVPADKLLPASRYASLPVHNFIDTHAYAQFQRLGLYPSAPATDAEFIRRASLDAIGVLPPPAELRELLGEPAASTNAAASAPGAPTPRMNRQQREAYINRLLARPEYADYWANKFADLLRPNPDRVGVKSVFTLDQWLRESFSDNKPYDQFVREILTAEGSNHRDGPAVIYRDRREPAELTTMFSQLFLGVRLECARCHHHPNEKWSQDDFYQLAAYFGPVKQKGAGLSPPISAGTETFFFSPGGSVKHPVSGAVMNPKPPEGPEPKLAETEDPRRALADWLTARDNPFFAHAIVNRVWANFFGRGLVEPVDDFRISNPCVNPPLLDALATDFLAHGCDLKHLMRTILNSQVYQLSSEPNPTNLTDTRNFSRSYRRRLPAEVLLDAVNDVTAVPDTSSAMPAGFRATQMWSYKIGSQFLDAFGRPNSSSDCPCERDLRTSVVQSLHLMHSRDLQGKLSNEKGRAHLLAASSRSPEEIVTELYLVTLSRYPTAAERAQATAPFQAKDATRKTATEDVLWALLNSAEFVFNH
jgi:hypothetical protein